MGRAGWFVVLGLAVMGCDKKDGGASATTTADPGARAVAVSVDAHGFSPNSVDVKKGERAQLVFTRTTDDTCAKEVVFPEINVTKELPLNKPVAVLVPTDAARTLTFQCGMAMYKSKVVIQ